MEQREIDMDKKLTSAFLGYACYDVVANQSGMMFKWWNDRKLEQPILIIYPMLDGHEAGA